MEAVGIKAGRSEKKPYMRRRCIICDRKDAPNYFTFKYHLAEEWFKSLRIKKPKFIAPNSFICPDHFRDSDMVAKEPEEEIRLKETAAPIFQTLNEKEAATLEEAERPKSPVETPKIVGTRVGDFDGNDGDEMMESFWQVDPVSGNLSVMPYAYEPSMADIEDDEDALEGTQQQETKMKKMNRLLGLELSEDRLGVASGAIPSWCSCGQCCLMPTPRENFCCREAIGSNGEFAKNLAQRVKQSPGTCVSSHPAFQHICLNEEAILTTSRAVAYATRTVLQEPMNKRLMRNKSYMAFSHWTHRKLGAGRRLEIPACECVVSQIRKEFPNDDEATFEGFTSDNEL